MLHFEDRQGGQKGFSALTVLLTIVSLLTVGCDDWKAKQKETITMEAFSELRTPTFFLDQQVIRKNLLDFANADHDGFEADKQTRNYYRSEGSSFVWLKRTGIDERADSLLAWLHQVNELGMSEKAFTVSVIEKDLERLRTLDFDEKNNINTHAHHVQISS